MISHTQCQLALRAKLLTLSVCTTGSATLAASALGYTRASGSFVADGFAPGMEVTPTGFTQTATGVVTAVTAGLLTIAGGRTVQTAGAGRTVAVGLPALRVEENRDPGQGQPVTGVPYVLEQYIPGPMSRYTSGPLGRLNAEPQYAVHVYIKSNTGFLAAAKYADALLTLFAPGVTVTLTNGDVVRVRGDVGPFRGQLMQDTGWCVVPVTIPLRIDTTNAV